MAEDINVLLSATDNISSVVKKISANIDTLSNNFGDLAGALQDLTKLQRSYAEASGVTVKATGNVGKAAAQSVKQVNSLAAAFAQPGLKGFKGVQIDFTQFANKTSAARIGDLAQRLREAGSSLSDFIKLGGRVDPNVFSEPFQKALGELNALRKGFNEPLAITSDFSDIEKVFVQTERLARRAAKVIQKEINEALATLGSTGSFNVFGDLEKTLSNLGSDSGIKNFDKIINFESVRDGAQELIQVAADLERRLIQIGPAAQDGSQEAVKEFRQLNSELKRAEQAAQELDAELKAAGRQFETTISGTNEALGDLNFRQVRLDDIFPTSEQQKVIQLQQKIDNAVKQSVQEGAVRTSLNFFLQLRKPIEQVDANVVALTSHLPRLRYALYDVSNTMGIAGAAILGAAGATIKFAADFERSFADVERTVGGTASSLKSLREDLVNLSQSIPVSFSDLADIATLAGQLNIASDVVADFTETVAKFSATTDVTIEAAATAFGRLDQLVSGVDGQFEKLGSSILKVGVNAVATESDIIAIAGQIASVANIAGFSASELIGFSSALASVGTRPELARGTFTRLFTEIQQAVADGGDQLDVFARTAGQSVQQFTDAWGAGSGAEQVVKILKGLNVSGKQADQVLAQLGITSVRDVPTLLKLAQSVGEVEKQIRIANLGFIEGTELSKQYDIITSTLSEKLVVLKNNFTALLVTLSGFAENFGFVIDAAIAYLRVVETILDNPISKFFLTIGTVLTGLVGILLLVGSAATRVAGSFAGMLTTAIETTEALAFTRVAVGTLGTQMEATTVSTIKATAAMGAYNTVVTGTAGANLVASGSGLIVVENFKKMGKEGTKVTGLFSKLKNSGLAKTFGAIGKQTKLLSLLRLGASVTAWGLGANLAFFAFDALAKKLNWFGGEAEEVEKKLGKIAQTDIGVYMQAAAKDTEDFANAAEDAKDEFTLLNVSVDDSGEQLSDYVKLVLTTNGELGEMAKYVNDVADAFGNQTIAIGENTKALIRQDLAASLINAGNQVGGRAIFDSLTGAFTGNELNGDMVRQNVGIGVLNQLLVDTDASELLKQYGFDYQAYVVAVEEGNVDLAKSIAEKAGPAIKSLQDNLDPTFWDKYGVSAYQVETAIDNVGAGLIRVSTIGLAAQENLKKQRIEAILSGEAFETAGEDISTAADDMKSAFDAIIEGSFGAANAQNELSSSMEAFGTVIANEGIDAAATSVELQKVLANIWATSDDGYDAGLNMAGFFNAIVEGGYASADQLGELQGSIQRTFNTFATAQIESLRLLQKGTNVVIGGFLKTKITSGKEQFRIADEIAQIESAMKNFDVLLGEAPQFDITPITRGFESVGGAASDAAQEVEKVQEEVRTLLDYASDLENIFKRAFDIRFGSISAIDNIASSWESFTKQVEDAQNALQELADTQADLAADRAIKEYFLSVAEAYDDQLRAAKLRAEIADLDKESAKNAKELADAQAVAAGANNLTGQTEGGRANRSALLGLVKNYQDYIGVLAESGASQDELKKATEEARQEFVKQARDLGFAEQDIMMYAQAFDDVRTAIDRVPRDITIDFNADPALQALNELNAKLDKSIEKAKELNNVSGQGSRNNTSGSVSTGPSKAALTAQVKAYDARIASLTASIKGYGSGSPGSADAISRLKRELNSVLESKRLTLRALSEIKFASGGFTGRGGTMQPAGIVHKGEYVVPQKYVNQSTGLPDANFLSQIQNGIRGYAMGGFVGGGASMPDSMMVELSPYDRKLLENAGNVQLRVDGKVVASATNRSNFNEARRGSN